MIWWKTKEGQRNKSHVHIGIDKERTKERQGKTKPYFQREWKEKKTGKKKEEKQFVEL